MKELIPLSQKLKAMRCPEVCAQLGLPKSSLYDAIAKGLVPPSFGFGKRSVGWPEHEIQAVLASAIAGQSLEERRALVHRLMSARRTGSPLQ